MSFVIFVLPDEEVSSLIDDSGVAVHLVVNELALLDQTFAFSRGDYATTNACDCSFMVQLANILEPSTSVGFSLDLIHFEVWIEL